MCFVSFEDSDLLQVHFANAHDSPPLNSPADSPKASTSLLQQQDTSKVDLSLPDPLVESILKKYSSNQKQQQSAATEENNESIKSVPEADLLQLNTSTSFATADTASVMSASNANKERELERELQTWREQLELSEKSRFEMSDELMQVKETNEQMTASVRKLSKEKLQLEQKLQ